MENILVSVFDVRDNLRCDMELPPHYTTEELLPAINEIMQSLTDNYGIDRFPKNTQIRSLRLGRLLSLKETFDSAGVYSGDELTIEVQASVSRDRKKVYYTLEEQMELLEKEKRRY